LALAGHTVDPHQFLGLEINPRAAAIAELVLWIGHLQWHFRTQGGMPAEPILRAFHNIQVKDAVLEADVSLARDARGVPLTRTGPDGEVTEVYTYANPRQPEWPAAEFIVGNPPFIGGKDIRARQGDEWTEALWAAHPDMNDAADFVMYWWDHAASLLTKRKTPLRRFGLVTTNSISQVFQRRTIERHLTAKKPVSLVMAIPDHPWTKAAADSAAVRIAMTVAEAGSREGLLREVTAEAGLDTDTPSIAFHEAQGVINADLTVGVDVTAANALRATDGLCCPGVKLHGAGFIVTRAQAAALGLGRHAGLDLHIREYRNGRDLMARSRDVLVIDLFGLEPDDIARRFPEVYQHVATTVKSQRDAQFAKSSTKDAEEYAREWWMFGKPRQELRAALTGLRRYIATVETAKHRVFQFLDATILPDNMLVAIGGDDAYTLGVLSSRCHVVWTLAQGATLEDRPRYSKSRCFDPFPFPATDDLQQQRIRAIAEDLDAHRKSVLSQHDHLTLTGLYNVLERLRAGIFPADLIPAERRTFDDGLVLILRELHDRLDNAVAAAYGWPLDLPDTEILARLVALNKERAKEEATGLVRWLRPDYQIPRFGTAAEKDQLKLSGGAMRDEVAAKAGPKPTFPADDLAQTVAVMGALAASGGAMDAAGLSAGFRQGRRTIPQIEAVLAALVRMGAVRPLDGGRRFLLPRAA
jgi:hypothetical protein